MAWYGTVVLALAVVNGVVARNVEPNLVECAFDGDGFVCFHVKPFNGKVDGTIVVKRNVKLFDRMIVVWEVAGVYLGMFVY